MNPTINQLLNRRSIRSFTDASIPDSDLELILRAGLQSPSSINGQQVSLIVTKERETIKKIAEIAGNQPQVACAQIFITIIIDFNRTEIASELAGKKQRIEQSAEGIVMGTLDAGIVLTTLQIAANSLGYGTTAIGGVRNDPQAIIDLLKLPKKTFPVCGVTLGVADEEKKSFVKPRVPLSSFAMSEHYQEDSVKNGVKWYDKELRHWWDKQNKSDTPSYIARIGNTYNQIYFRAVAKAMDKQGFKFTDE